MSKNLIKIRATKLFSKKAHKRLDTHVDGLDKANYKGDVANEKSLINARKSVKQGTKANKHKVKIDTLLR